MPCPIQTASQLSGLSPHVIRIWERRYGALNPSRTGTNRRMYCEEAIERLRLLKQLTDNGHRIGGVARRGTAELRQLAEELNRSKESPIAAPPVTEAPEVQEASSLLVQACVAAAKAYDTEKLLQLLHGARVRLGQRCMLHQVICPLIHEIGQAWQEGNLRPAHEHVASVAIREILTAPVPGSTVAAHAPELVVSTPAGEQHELGALLVSATARDLGWRITYLGPSLPCEEIAACARQRRARGVALSVVYPDRCPAVEAQLRSVRTLLPESMALLVGGRAAISYASRLSDLDIRWAHDLKALDQYLTQLSEPA